MKTYKIRRATLTLLAIAIIAHAQTPQTNTVPLSRLDIKAIVLPPATASTRLDFQVDPSTAGGDFFDVVIDNPQVVITLVTPANAEISAAKSRPECRSLSRKRPECRSLSRKETKRARKRSVR